MPVLWVLQPHANGQCLTVFSEKWLIDVNKDKADGDALDMAHGTSFLKPVSVYSGDWKDCAGGRYSRYNSRGKPKSRRNTN